MIYLIMSIIWILWIISAVLLVRGGNPSGDANDVKHNNLKEYD